MAEWGILVVAAISAVVGAVAAIISSSFLAGRKIEHIDYEIKDIKLEIEQIMISIKLLNDGREANRLAIVGLITRAEFDRRTESIDRRLRDVESDMSRLFRPGGFSRKPPPHSED